MQNEQKKTALFVDFDNIYLGLRETSREAAEAFATKPHVWLRWIEQGMRMDPDADPAGPVENRVLIRRCYLNPDAFGRYRAYFTRAGFLVVDCPPLTFRGKNSSDIVMVMDILDALRHETWFDEFVIMSADADFTPVLQRLRAHDRRSAVLVSGQAAPAYRAACDRLITEDAFIELALEFAPQAEPPRLPPPLPAPVPRPTAPVASAAPAAPAAPAPSAAAPGHDSALLAAMANRIYEEASSTGILSASELPRILREFKQFTPTSNWLGYYSLRSLTEAILAQRTDLRVTDDDPWRVAVQVPEAAALAADGTPAQSGTQQPAADWDELRDRVVQVVAGLVLESSAPVVMAKAAQAVLQAVGPVLTQTQWLGRGTFKALLFAAGELPFEVAPFPLPGFVYDPARHQPPTDRTSGDGLAELEDEMASFIRRVHQLTDAPKLTPHQYSVLFRVIDNELRRAPYNVMGTGKAVRDRCVERGVPIARQSVTHLLRGLGYAGWNFSVAPDRPESLANAYRGNLLNQLRRAQVILSDDELRMLDEWLLGELQGQASGEAGGTDEAAPADPAPDASSTQNPEAGPSDAEPDYAAWAEALLAQAEEPAPAPHAYADAAPATDAQALATPASAGGHEGVWGELDLPSTEHAPAAGAPSAGDPPPDDSAFMEMPHRDAGDTPAEWGALSTSGQADAPATELPSSASPDQQPTEWIHQSPDAWSPDGRAETAEGARADAQGASAAPEAVERDEYPFLPPYWPAATNPASPAADESRGAPAGEHAQTVDASESSAPVHAAELIRPSPDPDDAEGRMQADTDPSEHPESPAAEAAFPARDWVSGHTE